MKYWGRSLILYLAIITLLYGTKEVWSLIDYNRSIHAGPAHTTFAPVGSAPLAIAGLGGQTFGGGGASGY